MPFWSRKPAQQPDPQPAPQQDAVSRGGATDEAGDDEGVLLAALADLLAFVDGADDDRLDPDSAVQIAEDMVSHLRSLSVEGVTRVRDRLTALADAEEARGTSEAVVESLRQLADDLEDDEDLEPSGDDGREIDLAVIDAILTLETLEDERLDPDDGMKALELAAWHLSHLSAEGRARFVASIASQETLVREPHAAIVRGLSEALDLAGTTETFDAGNAEVAAQAMLTRKRVVVTTPKGRDQALRQAEALRQNGYVGRWEVPDERQAGRAQRLLREAGVRNIGVRVIGS